MAIAVLLTEYFIALGIEMRSRIIKEKILWDGSLGLALLEGDSINEVMNSNPSIGY